MLFELVTEEYKRKFYESYVRDCTENGDSAMTYEEWCTECAKIGDWFALRNPQHTGWYIISIGKDG